jgi:hypothetical protein
VPAQYSWIGLLILFSSALTIAKRARNSTIPLMLLGIAIVSLAVLPVSVFLTHTGTNGARYYHFASVGVALFGSACLQLCRSLGVSRWAQPAFNAVVLLILCANIRTARHRLHSWSLRSQIHQSVARCVRANQADIRDAANRGCTVRFVSCELDLPHAASVLRLFAKLPAADIEVLDKARSNPGSITDAPVITWSRALQRAEYFSSAYRTRLHERDGGINCETPHPRIRQPS